MITMMIAASSSEEEEETTLSSPSPSSFSFIIQTILLGLFGIVIWFLLQQWTTIRNQKNKQKKTKNNQRTRITTISSDLLQQQQPDKSCITCDAEECMKINPSKRCSRCKTVYYCSIECSKQHWKEHKVYCIPIEEMKYSMAGVLLGGGLVPPSQPITTTTTITEEEDGTKNSFTKSCCGICLQDEMINPVVLSSCGHAFCFTCLCQYQQYNNSNMHQDDDDNPNTMIQSSICYCPYCRTELKEEDQHLRESVISKAILYVTRASAAAARLTTDKELVEKYCQLAEQEINKLSDLIMEEEEKDKDKDTNDESNIIQRNIIIGHISSLRGNYNDALKRFQDNEQRLNAMTNRKVRIDALMEKGRILGKLKPTDETHKAMQQIQNQIMLILSKDQLCYTSDHLNSMLQVATIQQKLQLWEDAKTTYTSIMEHYMKDQSQSSPSQQRQVFMGYSKCLYNQGIYDGSIELGEAAIEMNRHYPNVHKYVALSYMAKGNIKQAEHIMAQAVLYETPWDPIHMLKVKTLWYELYQQQVVVHQEEE